MIEKFTIKTSSRNEMRDITRTVSSYITQTGVNEGICIVFVPHTTAAVTINENADPDVVSDITSFMSKLIPKSCDFSHCEGNSDSHIKASITGFSQHLIIDGGKLMLGRWQGIYFCEFDGPRNREFYIKVISG